MTSSAIIARVCYGENLSSALTVDRIRDLTRLMKPHVKVPAVRDFLERVTRFVEGVGGGSHSVTAEIAVPKGGASGSIIAQGGTVRQ